MYKNIGSKIQGVAVILGWGCLIISVILWIVGIKGNSDLIYGGISWLCLLAGVISFLMSWVLYGFGQLVEDTEEIKEKLNERVKNAKESPSSDSLPKL